VRRFKGRYGLNQVVQAVGVSEGSWHYAERIRIPYEEKYRHLWRPLRAIVRAHPEYGRRRVQTELREHGYLVNHKVVERLLASWELSLLQRVRKPRRSSLQRLVQEAGAKGNLVASLTEEEIEELEVLYTDFTELVYDGGRRKAYLMPILDHRSKLVVSHALGERKDTEVAMEAWKRARATFRKLHRSVEGVIVHHDQDGVYLGHRWLYELIIKDKVRVSYSKKEREGMCTWNLSMGGSKKRTGCCFKNKKTLSP